MFDDLLLSADHVGEVDEITMGDCLATALNGANNAQPMDVQIRLALIDLEASGLVQQVRRQNAVRWRVNPTNGIASLLKGDLL